MAKKTTPKKKTGITKGNKKSSTKGKNKVTKKKTAPKKAVKAAAKKKVTSKKTATRKTTTKKAAVKKSTPKKTTGKTKTTVKKKTAPKKAIKSPVKKKVTTKKTMTKKITTKKISAKKAAPKKKTTTPKTSTVKSTTKTTTTKPTKKREVKREVFKKPVITRAEALKKIKGYSKKDLEEFRAIILEKRDEILEDLQSLKEQMLDTSTGEYINENSPYSLHMAEQGTDAMEREKTFLYAQRENKFLGYLDDALKRIDNGTYGICIECIEEPQHLCETCPLVPKARLIAVPHTQHCLPIKQRKGGR
jgi:RNA polymerase-binding transcription factor DksA